MSASKGFMSKKSPKFLPFFSHSSSDISDWMGLSGAFFFFFLAGMVLGTPNTGGEPGNVRENHLIWEEESKNNLLPRTDKFKLRVNKLFSCKIRGSRNVRGPSLTQPFTTYLPKKHFMHWHWYIGLLYTKMSVWTSPTAW